MKMIVSNFLSIKATRMAHSSLFYLLVLGALSLIRSPEDQDLYIMDHVRFSNQ